MKIGIVIEVHTMKFTPEIIISSKSYYYLLLLCFVFVCAGFAQEPRAVEDNKDSQPEVEESATQDGDQSRPAAAEPYEEPVFIKDGKLDLEAAVKYFEDMYRSKSSISEVELIITKPRRERRMGMKIWTRGTEKALILIESPAREKGTATLKVDKNLWNYLPRIRRTIRIPPSMMLASWMGSDLTNDDLVRESSFMEDYTYELTGRTEDPAGWLITFEARPDTVGLWKRFELVVSNDGRIPLEARYYDRKDRPARTIYWDQVKDFDGRRIPSHLTLIPEDKDEEEQQKTEMIYHNIQFDVEVPESTFSLSNLEQKR
ncbi:MAG: outer membrane lipoprotein-sorting protein [Sedimentisphaerales bacterium]|nr:outer membrane lipoprotein-sorting protein [Sedimentisphaerales bacterium]